MGRVRGYGAGVVGPDWNARVALDTLEVLVSSGKVPRKLLRRVVDLLAEHQEEAIAAFHATMEHRFPGRLGSQEDQT